MRSVEIPRAMRGNERGALMVDVGRPAASERGGDKRLATVRRALFSKLNGEHVGASFSAHDEGEGVA